MERRILAVAAMVLVICASASAQTFTGTINPQIAFGGGYTTVYQVVHADSRSTAPATGRIEFTDPEGVPLSVTTTEMGTASSFNVSIPSQGTVTLTVTSSSSAITVGTVRYVSLDGVVTGAVARYAFGSTIVGVPSADSITLGYVPLTNDPGFQLGIAIANGSTTTPVSVQLDEVLSNGTLGQTGTLFIIPAKGQRARNVGPEVGLTNPFSAGSVLRISVIGSGAVNATPLLQGNNYISSATVYSSNNVEAPIYIPQVVVGDTYSTQINSMNTSGKTLTARLTLADQTGAGMSASISSSGATGSAGPTTASTSVLGPVPANGRVQWSLSSTQAGKVGWARVEWFDASSGLEIPYPNAASAIIRNGLLHVGVSGTKPEYSVAIPVNVGNGLNTGFALAFPGIRASTLTLGLIDSAGHSYPALVSSQGPAFTQVAKYVTEAFSGVPASLTGAYLSIQASTDGSGFLPFGLLDSSGSFSSTAVARRQVFSPSSFAGSYTGNWNNTTFGSTGSASMNVSVPQGSSTVASLRAAAPSPCS